MGRNRRKVKNLFCAMLFFKKTSPETWITKTNKLTRKHTNRMPIAYLPTLCASLWTSLNMSCTLRSNLAKFEHFGGVPVQWGPSWPSLAEASTVGGGGGLCMVSSNASWVMVTWHHHPSGTEWKTQLKTLRAIFLDQYGWERSNLNVWIQPILSCTQHHINFL